jgi:hypothetical protein
MVYEISMGNYWSFSAADCFSRMLPMSCAPERGHAQTVCTQCPQPPAGSLYVRYDLSHLRGTSPAEVIGRDAARAPWTGMWRYRSVLPEVEPVTLGEGWTPMLRSKRYRNVS